MKTFLQDVRQAVHMLMRNPGLALVAILALALGIGPDTAIFSAVNALLLTPPPYQDPDSIVSISQTRDLAGVSQKFSSISSDDFRAWRRSTKTLEQIAGYAPDTATLTGVSEPVRLTGARVSPALFALLRVNPFIGRVLRDDEEKPGNDRVVVLSYPAWANRFGKDPEVLKRFVKLDGNDYAVVGIMPQDFEFPNKQAEYWAPLVFDPPPQSRNKRRVMMIPGIARLKAGVTIAQAQAEGTALLQQAALPEQELRPTQPDMQQLPRPSQRGAERVAPAPDRQVQRMGGPAQQMIPQGARAGGGGPLITGGAVQLTTLQEQSVRPIRPALLIMLVAVGLVLLIACGDVANLLLSRAVDRHKEISIRASLGASRARIIRQILTESMLLALLGGAVGVLLGFWGVMLLPQLSPGNIPHLEDVRIDMRTLAFSLALSVLTGLLFGIAPALKCSRGDLMRSLKEGEAQTSAGLNLFRRNKTRSLLVLIEFALVLPLLIGAGLLATSFIRLIRQNPGYNPEGVLTLQLSLPQARYPQPEQQIGFFEQLLEDLRSVPGVQAAGITDMMPMSTAMLRMGFMTSGGPRSTDPAAQNTAGVRLVSPGFIPAMSIRLISGRDFSDQDRENTAQVVIINESMVRSVFAGVNPVGQRINLEGQQRQIIGVVADIKPQGLDSEPQPEAYLPQRQFAQLLMMGGPLSGITVVMRTQSDPLTLVPSVRSRVASLDSQLPVYNIATLKQRISTSVAPPRFYAVLLGIFAGLALLLAAVGIYGVFSYQVAQCTHEIGVRMALGAQRVNLLALVMRQGALLSAFGILLGLGLAWAGSKYLSSFLFGITATDPATYVLAALLMTGTALVASYLPARRATAIDPVHALRQE
jgi:putative ABC transport system permease protein